VRGGATVEQERNKSIDRPIHPIIIDRLLPWLHFSPWQAMCVMILF